MIKVFAIIEVKNGEFGGRTIEARFTLSSDFRMNGNGQNIAVVIETESGEITFLNKKLRNKNRFFFFPFIEDFGSCLFFEPKDEEEGGFERACETMRAITLIPKRKRLGIFIEEGRLQKAVIIEGREERSLLK